MIEHILQEDSIAKIIFANSNEGIMLSNEEGLIKYANPKILSMFGFLEKELLNQKIEILVPENLRDRHVENRNQYKKKPSNRSMGEGRHLLGLKKDGNTFPVEISLSPFNLNEEKYVLCFISNISKRREQEDKVTAMVHELDNSKKELQKLNKLLEDKVNERTIELADTIIKLKKSQKETEDALIREKELNSLKSKFISTASHEFRTPLATITTSLSLLNSYKNNEEKRERHSKRIMSSINYLLKILDDLLTIEKTDDAQINFSKEQIELTDSIDHIIEDIKANLKEGQQIIFEHQSKYQLQVNEYLFRNIITNLLSNAIKYSAENKDIIIRTHKAKDKIVIVVKDAGIGIPEDDQTHVFERFYRSYNTTATQGTGLGLYIVKRNLELINGTISFESKLNEGTTFVITIPIN